MFILLEDMKTKATRFTIFFAVSMLYPQVAMHRHHPGASPPAVAMGKRMRPPFLFRALDGTARRCGTCPARARC